MPRAPSRSRTQPGRAAPHSSRAAAGAHQAGSAGRASSAIGGGTDSRPPRAPAEPRRPERSRSKMMPQHPGQVSASEVRASAIVPCLCPPGSLVLEGFANLTPFVKEELRFTIQNKHLCHWLSSALESVTASDSPSRCPS
ncbi:cyclic AMP-dependent transcription factor ATF-3-like [Dasypus novemcinctus]|uniref:cyclic AMP-dependent transcription factor ATF-3-like n=1 Tax=Dasypus novemcinctus TaxID=9361 RepID=UPI0039C9F193